MNSEDTKGNRILQKIKLNIIPFAFVLYFFNGMDRVNVSYAALQMNKALNISSIAFGTITSVFFISYLIFQVPSNLLLQRVGINKLIPTLTIIWGFITSITFFAQSATHLTIFRLLLGVAEAGFFPGMIYYFTLWFPARERAQVTSLFMLSGPISGMLASPVSGWIVQHFNLFNYDGWRWLFAVEGIPTIFLGIMGFLVLKNGPKDVNWLNDEEKQWLEEELLKETKNKKEKSSLSFVKVITNGKLWTLACIYMFVQAATQSSSFWLPGIVKGFSSTLSDTSVGLIMMIPNIFAAFAMIIWGKHSDKTGERKYHTAIPMIVLAISFIMLIIPGNLLFKVVILAIYGTATFSWYGSYWTLPPTILSPEVLAVSIAVINSCSSFGGFAGNYVVGYVTKGFGATGVFIFEAILCIISCLMVVSLNLKNNASYVKADVKENV